MLAPVLDGICLCFCVYFVVCVFPYSISVVLVPFSVMFVPISVVFFPLSVEYDHIP